MLLPSASLLCCCAILSSFDVISAKPRPLLLVSFDGFRYDYLTRYETPTFKKLAERGVSAPDGYYPAFPSSTFPCHYTLVTGLNPESHGIVYNRMYDPAFNESFTLANVDTKWFDGGEPLWITARLKGLKSACFFWPGSQTVLHDTRPNYYKDYNKTIPFEDRINGVINWLVNDSVSFATLYFEQPDAAGHEFGPLSPQVSEMAKTMDSTLKYLLDKLTEAKLIDEINLIVTSDHGMTEVKRDDQHVLYLNKFLNATDYALVPQVGSIATILPKPDQTQVVYDKLVNAHPNISVYLKEHVPERFHYSKHRRIMPIVLLPDEGYLVLENKSQIKYYGPGQHGYDNRLPTMRPIFLASGPDFVQNTKAAEPFESVNVYPLMCHLLGIEPLPNNGSLENVRWMLRESNNGETSTKGAKTSTAIVLTLLFTVTKLALGIV